MKAVKGLIPLVGAAAAALALTAQAPAGISCHNINAKQVGQDLMSGVPIMTVGDVKGGGLLHGTTAGSFLPTGFVAPDLFFAGTITFTTNGATLTVGQAGSINVLTGAFTHLGPVVGATGKLAGATGSLTFVGTENLSTGAFTANVTGNICVDLSP